MVVPIVEETITFLNPILKDWNYTEKPLIINISGPQGSGKSYLSSKLLQYFTTAYSHLKSVTFSTDDIYLTHKDQVKVVKEYPKNVLLKGRGLPGTHDVNLGYQLLADLDNRKSGFSIPRYDKSAFNGEGDRAPEEEWEKVEKPADIVVFEGWFNGFTPFDSDEGILEKIEESEILKKYDKEMLFEVNSNLAGYIKLWDFVDVDIFYDTDDIDNVNDWRIQQEHELIKKKGTGMTDDEVRSFIERYMVVYELYYKDYTKLGIRSTREGKHLRVKINKQRDIEGLEVF
ncbi:CYFA0S01e15874g1_1 [Cyberlindnera fabianii]|uniref:CYFA0S01e15874g1_1 n=1 Tax=Cyberlindnera fabianii TaxID=36022 RepID=A0A061AKQ9_CYBFA|nr:CYFA0S01e15874g1_1 [Cyberlindnera fabianii]